MAETEEKVVEEEIVEEESLYAYEIEPIPFALEWKGRTWEGLADVNDPPTSVVSMMEIADMPAYTPAFKRKRDVKAVAAMVDFLSAVLVEWNYVSRRGEPLEISQESILALPGGLLTETFNAVTDLMQNAPEE